jgi:hypothetical protein
MLQWADRAQTNKDSRPQVFTATPRPPVPPPPPPMAPPQPSGWRPSPNYRGRNPKPPQFRTAPAPPPPSAPAPPTAPPPPPGWRPSPDPWTGLVQAWPLPWSAPTPYGAPHAYTGGWQPSARSHTGAPVLAPRPPTAAYHATPAYAPSIYNATPYASYGATSSPYMPQYNMSQYNDGGSLFTPMPALLPTPPHPPAPMTTPASTSTPSWDQAAFLQAMNNFAAQGNSGTDWIFDSGASSHMSASSNLLSSCTPSPFPFTR